MNTLKQEIKTLVEGQKDLKNQRKTINLVGERKVQSDKASYRHSVNRSRLRLMYLAQSLMKGLTVEQIEGKSKTKPNMELVNRLIEKYGKVIHTD